MLGGVVRVPMLHDGMRRCIIFETSKREGGGQAEVVAQLAPFTRPTGLPQTPPVCMRGCSTGSLANVALFSRCTLLIAIKSASVTWH